MITSPFTQVSYRDTREKRLLCTVLLSLSGGLCDWAVFPTLSRMFLSMFCRRSKMSSDALSNLERDLLEAYFDDT